MGALETPVAEGIDHQFSTNAAMIARSGSSPVLLQRRTDFSVPVHMHSFLDHGGLRDPRRPLAGLTFAAHFL